MQNSILRLRASALAASALVAGLLLAGCEPKKSAAGGEAAAKVNKEEIGVQQISQVLQQQRGLRPEQAEAASRQILERLIDQELTVQKATELKLDRDPKVQQQLEAARREVLSRAYVDKVGDAVAKPTTEEVAAYYETNPALFKDRRIYSLQEIAIEARPDQLPQLRERLSQSKSINDFVDYLKANDFRFSGNQAVRAAEQLPLASLGMVSAMKDGQAALSPTPNGALVLVLAGSRTQPVSLDKATPAIEQFLTNARKRELLAKDIKTLRTSANIEYVGKFAAAASAPDAGGVAAGAASVLTPAASEAAGAKDAAPTK